MFMGKLSTRILFHKQNLLARMRGSPGGLWVWMEIEFIFTCRSFGAEIKILSYGTQGPFEPCFLPGCEKLCRWSVWENLLLCWTASMAAAIGENRKQAKSLWSSVQPTSSRKLNRRSNMNSSVGAGLHPGLSESNTQIVIQLWQKSTQEACQGESWAEKRAEAVTNEGDAERDVHVLGLSLLEHPSCALLPAQQALLNAASMRKKKGESCMIIHASWLT